MGKPINHFRVKPRVNLTPEIKATELITPGIEGRLSSHKIWVPANIEYPVHSHPSPHIIIVLEGGGYMKCGEGKTEVHSLINPGDVFHVPENMTHQVGADSRGCVMIAISVDSKSLKDPERLKIIKK
ncbi:MAG: AraC family ligand binding domain-containing protein [Candidatus Pacebacteria bacterium]|nr:AraC family ligand binding domain-containing protein [Candidatus Paceibacterota bacterium]MDD5357309.1 AraC family ligand binding domain-containing protein [Candidatus Paceibacterota bacterium]